MPPISSKSLNGANSGSRGPGEEVKKEKSSEFNPRNDGQVRSGARLDKTSNKLLVGPTISA